MESSLDKYLREHATVPSPALAWIEQQTNIHTNYPRMLSGPVQGELLKILVAATGTKRILEIGSFTGYSSTAMALGLPDDGHIDALEINDELEDLMRAGWRKAGIEDKITLHIGDAVETLERLAAENACEYDFVFIDANKRQYLEYYELVLPLVRKGGLIIADDVLWDGKVYADPLPHDAQSRGIIDFNDTVAKDPRVEVVILPLRDGLSIIRKK